MQLGLYPRRITYMFKGYQQVSFLHRWYVFFWWKN